MSGTSYSFKGVYRLRWQIFSRDDFTCQYCGRKAPDVVLEVDHKNPVANGGDWELTNLVTACSACNRGKGALSQYLILSELRRRRWKQMPNTPTIAYKIAEELVDGNKGIGELVERLGTSEGTIGRTLRRMVARGDAVKLNKHTWGLFRKGG